MSFSGPNAVLRTSQLNESHTATISTTMSAGTTKSCTINRADGCSTGGSNSSPSGGLGWYFAGSSWNKLESDMKSSWKLRSLMSDRLGLKNYIAKHNDSSRGATLAA